MADARRILEALSRKEVSDLARALGVPVTARLTDPELREALVQSPRSPLDKLLASSAPPPGRDPEQRMRAPSRARAVACRSARKTGLELVGPQPGLRMKATWT